MPPRHRQNHQNTAVDGSAGGHGRTPLRPLREVFGLFQRKIGGQKRYLDYKDLADNVRFSSFSLTRLHQAARNHAHTMRGAASLDAGAPVDKKPAGSYDTKYTYVCSSVHVSLYLGRLVTPRDRGHFRKLLRYFEERPNQIAAQQ